MEDEKKFTQEDVNRIIKERLAQERAKGDGETERRIAEAVKASEDRAKAAESRLLKQMLTHELECNRAVSPEEISKLLAGDMKLNEAGEAVSVTSDGKEKPLGVVVKEYLAANTWAVRPVTITGVTPADGSGPIEDSNAGIREAFGLK